jgi:tight adherence protein C
VPLELLALSLTFGFAVGLVVWMVIQSFREVQAEAAEAFEVYSTSPLFQASLPFVQYVGRRLDGTRILWGLRSSIAKKLVHAGKSLAITPEEFIGWMIVWGGIGALVAAYFRLMIAIDWPVSVLLTMLCSLLPFMKLGELASGRQKAIRKILPYALDLLCLAVEAGLDFTAALNRIGDNLKRHPFRDEIRLLARDISMGKTRAEALRDMERRIGLEELTSVVSALVQADELGASLGPALRIQSQELQRVRFQRAEKKAMQAPVLMLIPLVLFIFPLVFLIIFTPIILKMLEQA